MNKFVQVNLSEEEVNEQSKSWASLILCCLAIAVAVSEAAPHVLGLF